MWRRLTSTETGRSVLMISPPFLYALVLMAFPLVAIFLFSFWTQDFMDVDTTFTLNNYREIAETLFLSEGTG